VATIGALATVEVAVNGGNAAERFRVRRGDKFEILFPSPQDRPAG
jgi:S-adenosylmethionine hydrolase